jgi:hypothetical protein
MADDLANWQAIVADPAVAGNAERWTKDGRGTAQTTPTRPRTSRSRSVIATGADAVPPKVGMLFAGDGMSLADVVELGVSAEDAGPTVSGTLRSTASRSFR